MSKSRIYGKGCEAYGKHEFRNSFVTINLGNNLWVNVPNIVDIRRGKRHPLYAFSLDPILNPEETRIVANCLLPGGKMRAEPTGRLLVNDGFIPWAGQALEYGEYPKVLVRTFSVMGLGLGNVGGLYDEQQKAQEDGWLCRVADSPPDIMPDKLVLQMAGIAD